MIQTKVCTKCGEELPATTEWFHKQKNGKFGLSAECKNCKKKYQEENKEKFKEYQKKWYENNKEKIRKEATRRYWMDVEKSRELEKQRYKNNPDPYKWKSIKRKTLKKGLPATLTSEQWEDIKEKFNNQCAYCGEQLPLEQEHFIPVSKGGDYTKTNIIPACKSCNSSKRDRKPVEWYQEQEFYTWDRLNKIIGYFNANGKSFWKYGSLGVTRSCEEV